MRNTTKPARPAFTEPPPMETASPLLVQLTQLQTMLREAAYGGLTMPVTVVTVTGITVSLLMFSLEELIEWATWLEFTAPMPTSSGATRWTTCGDAFGLHLQLLSGGE